MRIRLHLPPHTHLLEDAAELRVRLRGAQAQLRSQPVDLVEHEDGAQALAPRRAQDGGGLDAHTLQSVDCRQRQKGGLLLISQRPLQCARLRRCVPTTSAPSQRRAAAATSIEKSTCPGESMRLTR